jgi:GNAT superfamily N-acetyltransferase
VDLSDVFFDSLKSDYEEFPEWFAKKSAAGESALVFYDELGIGSFVYLKEENEPIELKTGSLPAMPRLKIGTLRLAERFRGQRLGEGALGVSLWRWQEKKLKEIYVTVFDKHTALINLFEHFGFRCEGKNSRGEFVYIKSRDSIDFSDAYKAFPFIRPDIDKAGIVPVFENFHDRLFPYSELKGNNIEIEEETAGNGITKVYIGTPYTPIHYYTNEPVCIYRIFQGERQRTYKSVITSYCTITKLEIIKEKTICRVSLYDYIKMAGNKTVFTEEELTRIYKGSTNVVMLEMVYNGYFGKGHNVTHKELKDNGLFNAHPYNIDYSKDEFIKILEMGDVNVQNVIID